MERLRSDLVGDEELQRAKNQVEAAYVFGQDSTVRRASTLGRYELCRGWRLRESTCPASAPSRREDLRRVAQRYFVRERQTTAMLVPVAAGATAPPR